MRLGRRLSTGTAEDPPAPRAAAQAPTAEHAVAEHARIEAQADREVRREYAEQAAER